MDIRSSAAALGYAATRPATQPKPDAGGQGVGQGFAQAASDFAKSLQQTEELAKAGLTGNADPHSLVMALAQTELAVETAVTVRDRVVAAYQEILRMPV